MDTEMLKELIEYLKSAGGVVWQATYRQIYVEVARNVLYAVVCMIVSVVSTRILNKLRKSEDFDDYIPGAVVAAIVLGTAALCGIASVNGAIGRLINPDFYVIRYFLQVFVASGS